MDRSGFQRAFGWPGSRRQGELGRRVVALSWHSMLQGCRAVGLAAWLVGSSADGLSQAPAASETPSPNLAPAQLQALERATQAVVVVRSEAVEGARSARTLGRQREGSGIVIGADGLVLTIGYLVLEAEKVWITDADGRTRPARVLAQDLASGFALLQSLVPLNIAPVALGTATNGSADEPLLVASGGDDGRASLAQLLSRRPFSGYWEYHLDEALYTAPARRDHSGAGLFNLRGELVGVGSLVLSNAAVEGQPRTAGNLFVPTDLLNPILGSLRQRSGSAAAAAVTAAPRAWLGVNCTERDGELWVLRVTEDSPAERAGLVVGDRIIAIDGRPVTELGALWKALWNGGAERDVTLQIRRQGQLRDVAVRTVDRAGTLKRPEGV